MISRPEFKRTWVVGEENTIWDEVLGGSQIQGSWERMSICGNPWEYIGLGLASIRTWRIGRRNGTWAYKGSLGVFNVEAPD